MNESDYSFNTQNKNMDFLNEMKNQKILKFNYIENFDNNDFYQKVMSIFII